MRSERTLIITAPRGSGGSYTHLAYILPRLMKRRPDWSVELHASREVLKTTFGTADEPFMRPLTGGTYRDRLRWEFVLLPRLLRATPHALLWAPFGPPLNPALARRTVWMSRNIIPLLPHKDWEVSAPDRPRLLAMRALVVLWARLARRTICVSQDARARLARVAGVDASSIPVIPHGVESIDPSVPCVSPDLEALRSGPYILHVGQPTAYRRTKQLFEAYASLVASGEDVPPLFVAGRARPSDVGYERECLRILEPALRRERARMLGQVKHDDVLALMSKAHTFVYPSVHENCPNVVLEALAAGRVSVYADIAPVRELADDAALYVPNPSGPELASAIRIATSDDVSRRSLSARAVERAAQFTWERTADSTAAVLDDAFRASSGNQAARN